MEKENNQCASICNLDESYARCPMKTKFGHKYCPMHMLKKNVIDYDRKCKEIEKESIKKNFEFDKNRKRYNNVPFNPIISRKPINNVTKNDESEKIKCCNYIPLEYQKDAIKYFDQMINDELKTKLLILMNNEEYHKKIPNLIGPVFDDITKSDDNQDPITFDIIWTELNGIRIPSSTINRYFLFSYVDSQNRVRCFTIFTIYNMIKNNNLVHPITMEPIPKDDIDRARQLVDMYRTKIGIFNNDELHISSESKLRNRLTKLFKQLNMCNVYLEENWFLTLEDRNKLLTIINETRNLISNNIKHNNNSQHLSFFEKKSFDNYSILQLKEYIVGEWEKMIIITNNMHNVFIVWIIISGLAYVIPEIRKKYPNLEIIN